MLIAVAGPYSAETAEGRRRNLNALNQAALEVFRLGHVPVIGVNAALPVVEFMNIDEDRYEAIMKISLAIVGQCDALLIIGESPGVNRERDLISAKGRPVYNALNEIPRI